MSYKLGTGVRTENRHQQYLSLKPIPYRSFPEERLSLFFSDGFCSLSQLRSHGMLECTTYKERTGSVGQNTRFSPHASAISKWGLARWARLPLPVFQIQFPVWNALALGNVISASQSLCVNTTCVF
ncbi:hypothetical protein BaRGS_00000477 [Batillaria attramentaria]|uniref:Uncharacterized protein n=1 Tax=Batillaria attramentaria TaxID=370345 RepID=A0ABD0M8U7_9CAEN